MNDNEAIQVLNKWLNEHGHMPGIKHLARAVVVAIKALEKQAPQKAIKRLNGDFWCPACRCNVIYEPSFLYCWHCGQALEFGGDSDE